MNSRLLVVVSFVVSLAIYFGYVSPTWSGSIAETKAAIAADDKALTAAADFATHQKDLIDARAAMSPEDLKRLTTMFPDSVNNIGLILDLNALAARSGVSITAIEMTNPASSATDNQGVVPSDIVTPEQSLDFTLTAVGSYSAFKTFLAGIEKSERLIDIRDLNIKGSDTGVYTYLLKLRVYWLRS